MDNIKPKITVVGCGYVGRPLLDAFRDKGFRAYGYDTDQSKHNKHIGTDITEVLTSEVVIFCLPTPVDRNNFPDLSLLESSIESIDSQCDLSDKVVIIESTYAPFTTKKLMKDAGIKQFGYSPERINPGDSKRTLRNTTKLVSGNIYYVGKYIKTLYEFICDDVYLCPSIEVAEASKLLENVQRDVNIALINEAQGVFKDAGIDTLEVLKAASTKWNFVDVKPGLVGGHCIGVDPYYYLKFASEKAPFQYTRIVKAAREASILFEQRIFDAIFDLAGPAPGAIHFEGYAFKGNCRDIRNSRTIELLDQVAEYHDDWKVTATDCFVGCGGCSGYTECDILVLTVNHNYIKMRLEDGTLLPEDKKMPRAIVDIHGIVSKEFAEKYNIILWQP